MTQEELIRFLAERHVANYDVANDGSFGRKLSDFEPWEQKAIIEGLRLTLNDLSAAGFAIVPKEPTPEMVCAAQQGVKGKRPASVSPASCEASAWARDWREILTWKHMIGAALTGRSGHDAS